MAIYKYRIEAKKVAPGQGSKLLGTATLNIAGQFKVTGIQIWQGKGGKPFVSMPSYKSNKAGANGKPVYKQQFHAIGADQKQVDANGKPVKNEVQELLNKNVLKAYEKSSEIPGRPGEYEPGRFDYSPEVDLEKNLSAVSENKETPLKITARMTAVPERNGLLGYGSIRVGDFQLNSVQYRASADNPANRYAAMPSYSVVQDGKPAYYNVGYPVTTECSTTVREAVREAYEYSLQHQASQVAETNPFLEEAEEETKEVQKEQEVKESPSQEKADAVSRRKEIRQELCANGFKANNALVSGIERLDAMTGKPNTLRDIKELAKDAHISAEAKETVNEVVENLQQQEAKMQAPEPPAPAMEPA